MKALKLEVIFGSKNNLSPALKAIIGSSNAASRALKKTRDEVKALNDQQKKIDGYTKQKKATEDSAKALRDLQTRIKDMRRQMASNPSAALTKEFDQATAKAKKLKQQYEQNRIQLQRMRTEMTNSGLSTNQLADHQQRLRNQLNQANQAMHEQEQRLRRMGQMQQNHQRSAGKLRTAAMAGMGAAVTGGAALYQMRKPIDESKRYDVEQNRIAAIGLGDDVAKKAVKYAKAMDTFGTSILDNTTLVRDGMTIFSDLHHAEMVAPVLAKMKFANEAMFGQEQGGENERKFMDMLKVIELRGGLKSQQAFNQQANMIQQVITATGGRVEAPEWLNAIKTGGLAVKGMSNEALYYKMESIVQEWGGFRYGTAAMSAYQNIYQGRTTKRAANNMERLGLIEDPSKLKHDKAGQIAFLDVGAIKGSDLFKKDQFEWMQQVLLPQLAKKGITEQGDVLDAIGSIFTNRTASNLFSDMYLQRDIINKSAKMNAGADNIDQINGKAMGTTSGKELDAKAKLHNAYLIFGQTILPIYTKALEVATSAMQGFTGWMERNPTLAKMLGAGLLTIAVSLVAIGAGLAIFSPLILGMLSLRLMMASAGTSATVLGRVFGFLPKIFNVFKAALFGVGKLFLWLGRMMLTNPILLAITAIAVAAYLIYKNWEPIKAFFVDLWNGVKNTFNTFTTWLESIWSKIKSSVSGAATAVWDGVNNAFNKGVEFVKNIIRKVDTVFANNPILTFLLPFIGIPRLIIANWSSISAYFSALWNTISAVFSASITWVTTMVMSGFITAKNYILSIWTGVSSFFSTLWAGISAVFSASITWVSGVVKVGFNAVRGFVSSIWNSIKNFISTAWQGICSLFKAISPLPYIMSAFNSVFSWLSGLYNRMMSLGSNIIQGLTNGIKAGFEKLKGVWATVNSWMPDFMRKKMDIHSPSRVMSGLGGHIMSGLGVGLDKAFPSLRAKFSDVLGIFKPNNTEVMQKINVAPALAKIRPGQSQLIQPAQGNVIVHGDTITLHIHARPGQSINELQFMIENIMNKRDRQKQAQIRSSFKDSE